MYKKFVYIGILLIVLVFLIPMLASGLLMSTTYYNNSFAINSSGIQTMKVQLAGEGEIAEYYNSTGPLNVYLINGSNLQAVEGYITNKSNLALPDMLKNLGKIGVLAFAYNSSVDTLLRQPAVNSTNSSHVYFLSKTPLFVPGTYYSILQNVGNNIVTAKVTIGVLNINMNGFLGLGIFVILGFVAGLVLIIWGIFKKPKTIAANEMQTPPENVRKAYEEIEKKGKKKESR